MRIDPSDDCTFWYVNEYLPVTSSYGWYTHIGSFKLAGCGGTTPNNPPTASFTFSCTNLNCTFNGSASSDSDGTISSYAWSFGDGGTGSGVATSHTYATGGTYTVTLTVTDNGGATGNQSQNITVSGLPATGMHVGDLDGSKANNGSTWTATVTITVHNASHNPVEGATVNGSWSNGATGSSSCLTNASGQCSVSKPGIAKKIGSVTFTANSVTGSLTYNSGDNHDPESDSRQANPPGR
jgi:PKD repeat protein